MSFAVINEKSFIREVLESSQPVLVYFWAPWCGLCHLMHPIVEKIQSEQQSEIKLITINADENLKLANTYKIKNLPTLLLFNNGILSKKLDDFNSREGLYLTLDELVSNVLTTTTLKG